MRKLVTTTILALAGLTLGTAQAAPSVNLLNRDTHGHLALNSVPLGVPLAKFAPACKGDPTTASVPCVLTAPEIDGYGVATVYGLPVVNDGARNPVFSGANVTTHHGIIDGVHLIFSNERYESLFRDTTNDVAGLPDWKNRSGADEWHGVLSDAVIVVGSRGQGAEFGIVTAGPQP